MGKLLEVIRRLALSVVYLVGFFFAGGSISVLWNQNYIQALSIAVLVVCATYAVHQLINWILLKDEKNAPPGNQ